MSRSNRSVEKEAFWRLALEEHQRTDLTARAYCRQEGLSESSFYAWRKKIQKRDAKVPNVAGNPQALIPVDVVEAVATSPRRAEPSRPLEVVTPSGFKFRFHNDIDPRQLNSLLGVIAHCNGAASC